MEKESRSMMRDAVAFVVEEEDIDPLHAAALLDVIALELRARHREACARRMAALRRRAGWTGERQGPTAAHPVTEDGR